MKKNDVNGLIKLYAMPTVLIILGLVLSFSPDTASSLLAAILGWGLVGAGVCVGAVGIFTVGSDRLRMLAVGAVLLGVGIFVVSFPMSLSRFLGRIVGVLLLLRGIRNIREAIQRKQMDYPYGCRLGTGIVTAIAGVVLIVLPMTLSRVIMNICGIILIVVGVLNIVGRLWEKKQLEEGQDPNIIDADS